MTSIRTIRLAGSTWTPRGQGDAPTAAALPIVVEVVGETITLVPDLCDFIARALGMTYGEDVVPADTLPAAVLKDNYPADSFALRTQQSQPAPEYFDQEEEPEVSLVRLDLVQTITQSLADLPMLYARRRDVQRLLSGLNADVGPGAPAPEPVPPSPDPPMPGRAYSTAYSSAYG